MEKYAKTCARIEERIGTVAMPTVIETEDFYEGEDKSEKSEPNMIAIAMKKAKVLVLLVSKKQTTNARKGGNRRSSTRYYAAKNVGFTFTRGGHRGRTSSTVYFQGT